MRSVGARTLQLGFSIASLCVAAAVLLIILDASIVRGEDPSLDLARGRDVVLTLSIVFLAGSGYLVFRAIKVPKSAKVAEPATAIQGPAPVDGPVEHIEEIDTTRREELLRSLSEDEFGLYQMLEEAGGAMLQMNIVATKAYSKAKVTRLLNKLEARGLIVRERKGMTNRVRIIR